MQNMCNFISFMWQQYGNVTKMFWDTNIHYKSDMPAKLKNKIKNSIANAHQSSSCIISWQIRLTEIIARRMTVQ